MKKHNHNPRGWVLFDWDGCLADTISIWQHALIEEVHKYDDRITPEAIIRDLILGGLHNLPRYGITDINGFATRTTQAMTKKAITIKLHANAQAMLDTVQQMGFSTSLVTSSRHEVLNATLQNLHLSDYFETIVDGDQVTHHKPHPEPIEKAMKSLNADPNRAIFVGDTGNDIGAARSYGIPCILTYPTSHEIIYNKDHILGLCPDYIVRNLTEIPPILEQEFGT